MDGESLVGDACHMVARQSSAARGHSQLTSDERDRYNNLILLCKVHHKLVDDQPGEYSVERLFQIKRQHEAWVAESLDEFDPAKQRDDEIYADYIDQWAARSDLDQWLGWSSSVLGGGQPKMSAHRDAELEELRVWLFSRVWPERYAELEAAFENYRRVLQDLHETFREYAEPMWNGDFLVTRKFYRIDRWDPPLYKRLGRQYDFHVAFVEDLMLELTRAANYVCDRVRQLVDSRFRLREGLVLAGSGPYLDLTYHHHRPEYRGHERTLSPYPGLEQFKIDRRQRDEHFGEGTSADDPDFHVGGGDD
ncbi:MAG: hypothetical protein WEE64_01210 [Dehalococcoidia bacterium]